MKNDFLHTVFWSSRPVSWINTAYPFAAAYLLAGHSINAAWILGSLFFLIPYNLLMYGVNDVFDYESDIRNPRKGGVEGATVAKKYLRNLLLTAIGVNIPFVVALLYFGHVAAKLTLFAIIFMVLAYSLPKLRFKERPFLDSITSSSHFTGPLVYGLVLAGWHAQYLLLVFAMFAWGLASHAFGAVQDIGPDREAGIGSVATVIGARATVRFSLILYLASGLLLGYYGLPGWIIGICSLLYVANVWPYRSISDADSAKANRGWRRFMSINMVTGFVVTIVLILVFRRIL